MHSHPLNDGFLTPVSGIDAVRGLGTSLSHVLRMTRTLVTSGRSVDITGLDRQIGLLCAKTLDLPPEEGRELRPMLIELLTELDTLSIALEQQPIHPLPD